MKKLTFALAFALIPAAKAQGQTEPLLSIPGLADAVATMAKASKAVGTWTLDNKLSIGGFTPIRTLHDSQGTNYAAAGVAGSIKQGEHMKGGPALMTDASAIVRRLESRSGWYEAHVTKLTLPDFWLGLSLLPPLDSSFTWKSIKGWSGVSIAVGW